MNYERSLICETLSSQESVKKISEYGTENINADGNINILLVFIPQRLKNLSGSS
jgi:hypothetical protein